MDSFRSDATTLLSQALPLGVGKFVGYERGLAVFVYLDVRARVHRIELDRAWMMTQGMERSLYFIAEAVESAGASLSAARRN